MAIFIFVLSSSITISNQNVASVGAISGIEGNKMEAVNGLQGGTSTITTIRCCYF